MRNLHGITIVMVLLLLFLACEVVYARHPLDTDSDGIPDRWEADHELNPYDPNDANLDYNYDNLTNIEEYKKRWDPWDKDTDDDGISNYAEYTGLFGFFSNPVEEDTDDDGLDDLSEICRYVDTDNQRQIDEIYQKSDQLRKLREKYPYNLDPLNPDIDGDGLDDGDEIKYDTSPNKIDWDRDGLSDGDEVHKYQTEPTERDTDEDGLTDYEEIFGTYGYVTDPKRRDSNSNGIPDGEAIFGFGFAPISPSKHVLTYEEFIRGNAYAGEYITMTAKVKKIKEDVDMQQKSYRIFLKSLNGSSKDGNRAVVKVNNRYHLDIEHDFIFTDDRFDITLKGGDTVALVGEARIIEGITRELVVNETGKIYLLLLPGEMGRRWLPSTKYVKVIQLPASQMPLTPTPYPTLTSEAVQISTSTPSLTPTPKTAQIPTPTVKTPGFLFLFPILSIYIVYLILKERGGK